MHYSHDSFCDANTQTQKRPATCNCTWNHAYQLALAHSTKPQIQGNSLNDPRSIESPNNNWATQESIPCQVKAATTHQWFQAYPPSATGAELIFLAFLPLPWQQNPKRTGLPQILFIAQETCWVFDVVMETDRIWFCCHGNGQALSRTLVSWWIPLAPEVRHASLFLKAKMNLKIKKFNFSTGLGIIFE